MSKFYFTFPSAHPLGDNFIVIEAGTETLAREEMRRWFGDKWAGCYWHDEWVANKVYELFPDGQVGKTLEGIE